MHYLIYVSQANKPMDAAALESILSFSRKNNSEKDITGLLIYRYSPAADSGHFIQMLEGEKTEVRALYEKISRDKRHHTVLLLREGEIPARMFSDWAMGFKNVDDTLFARLPGHARVGTESFDPAAFQHSNDEALGFLKFFHDAS